MDTNKTNREEITVSESRAIIYIPDNAVDAELTFKIYVDGELVSATKTMDMKDIRDAIDDAAKNYFSDDDIFVITEKGRQYVNDLK